MILCIVFGMIPLSIDNGFTYATISLIIVIMTCNNAGRLLLNAAILSQNYLVSPKHLNISILRGFIAAI